MTIRAIRRTGARGGHGTTTTAAALALFSAEQSPTAHVSSDAAAAAALIGVPPTPTARALRRTSSSYVQPRTLKTPARTPS